jgi:hypothetical protein
VGALSILTLLLKGEGTELFQLLLREVVMMVILAEIAGVIGGALRGFSLSQHLGLSAFALVVGVALGVARYYIQVRPRSKRE